MNSADNMPVAAWAVQTCKEKDATLEVVKTTSLKKFSLRDWEFVSPRSSLKRKHSGDGDSSGVIDIELSFPVLRAKEGIERDGGVVLSVNAASVICQVSTPEIPTPILARVHAIDHLLSGADDDMINTPTAKAKAKAKVVSKGGTWSTKHLLR